jgi:hypothetical protein
MDQQAQTEALVAEFYASLSPAEKEAHAIAKRMLGSSYIPDKTKSFLKWFKKTKDTASAPK